MPEFTDQTGRVISLDHYPKRIVSLVPSQTELLFDLGLEDAIAGITKFCVHPKEALRTKTKVGGTKQLTLALIHELKPDLIIANKEENVKEQVEQLAEHYPVWTSDVENIGDALAMIASVGAMTNRASQANTFIENIRNDFAQYKPVVHPARAAYLIWQNPFMTAGGDTFIHSMMETAGFENIFAAEKRYPETGIAELRNCDVLMLSSEPFPFKEKHAEQIKNALQENYSGAIPRVILVDGEMFSWYGSRLLKAPAYFRKMQEMM